MKKIYKIISKVLSGWSLSKALFLYENPEMLSDFLKGKSGFNEIEFLFSNENILSRYTQAKTLLDGYTFKLESKLRDMKRKIAIINFLIVLIMASITPAVIFLNSVKVASIVPSSTDTYQVQIDPIVSNTTFVYGALQTIVITLLIRRRYEKLKEILKVTLRYIVIYVLVYNLTIALYLSML